MSIRVGYDAQIFDLQERGGISRYFHEIVGEFNRQDLGVDARIVRRYDRSRRYVGHGANIAVAIRSIGNLRGISHEDVDVWHSTYYRARYLPTLNRRPHVVTIHDMLPERFPEWFPDGNPHLAKAQYARTASAVIVPSAYTASELQNFYPWLEASVHTIPEAASALFFRPEHGSPPSALADPYFLYVGARDGYKDFQVLLAALTQVKGGAAKRHLVAVGGGKWTRRERAEIARLGLANRVSHAATDDVGLLGYYADATALVVTARAEGFGLPMVEAMAAGCPVISTSGGALPEVAAGAALYFEPGDVAQLVERMEVMANDDARREEFVAAGQRRAAEFSWEHAARKLAEVYRGLARA